MSYYQQSNYPSNYPPGGMGYPPSSGPPPPPGAFSAYNVNQYAGGYQQQPQFGYPMQPQFQMPAVQLSGVYGQGQGPPPSMQMPPGTYADSFNNMMLQRQQQMMEQMQKMVMEGDKKGKSKGSKGDDSDSDGDDKKKDKKKSKGKGKKKDKKRGKKGKKGGSDDEGSEEEEDDDDDDDEEEEEEEEKGGSKRRGGGGGGGGMTEADFKVKLKTMFVDELCRRQAVSGIFEMTEGTVRGVGMYLADDPVVTFNKSDSDLTGKPWDPEADCIYLRKAMKGAGTDEDAIIHVVTSRNNSQRQELKTMFKTMYGRDLIEDINSELSGNFRECVMALFVEPARYDAWCVQEAIYGLGTDEESLIEILMTRTNSQIQEMRRVYGDVVSPNRKTKATKLEEDIKGDCSGYFKKLCISAAQGNRSEIKRSQLEDAVEEGQNADGTPNGMYELNFEKLCDMGRAKREAEMLFKAGEDKWGTDEETFNRIFSTRDYYQLRATWKEYVKISQRDILNSIDRETSGSYKKALTSIAMNIRCRPMYFAEGLKKAMKGLGTSDSDLIRIIVSRSEIDMMQIKQCFLDLTKQTLWRWLKDDCSGDYKKILQAVVGRD